MAILDNIIQFGNSNFIQASANFGQIYSVAANSIQLSSDELLKRLMSELYLQDGNLENILKYLERIIFQFEKSLENDKIIISQNEKLLEQNEQLLQDNVKIISLLNGRK